VKEEILVHRAESFGMDVLKGGGHHLWSCWGGKEGELGYFKQDPLRDPDGVERQDTPRWERFGFPF